MVQRVGIGHDTHRLAQGGPLLLGGIEIPHEKHAVGHSDADVLLHAVIDALLGAAGLGDIGEMFPDTDALNRDRDSADMLRLTVERITQAGFAIGNLDCIVFAERPKITQYKEAVTARIASLVGMDTCRVNLKAKTGEGIGPIGQEQAIAAQVVVLLEET